MIISRFGVIRLANWETDKKWSDRFLPEIKKILGLHLIGEPPMEEDCERNTDLMVLKMDPVRIACRIRKCKYYDKYPNDITIRCSRPSGTKTELAKIIEGWGDYFFYGFCDSGECFLIDWRLCDLKAFRLWFNGYIVKNKGTIPGVLKNNGDGSSDFRAFDSTKIKNFIIAQA